MSAHEKPNFTFGLSTHLGNADKKNPQNGYGKRLRPAALRERSKPSYASSTVPSQEVMLQYGRSERERSAKACFRPS